MFSEKSLFLKYQSPLDVKKKLKEHSDATSSDVDENEEVKENG